MLMGLFEEKGPRGKREKGASLPSGLAEWGPLGGPAPPPLLGRPCYVGIVPHG